MNIIELRKNPRSFPEDYPHENGNYLNSCFECHEPFIGHKRRVVCRQCAKPPKERAQDGPAPRLTGNPTVDRPTPETDAEINDTALEDRNAPHTDWVRADFARKMERERDDWRSRALHDQPVLLSDLKQPREQQIAESLAPPSGFLLAWLGTEPMHSRQNGE